MTINNLPADEKQGINRDLQNLNCNITVGEKNLNQLIDSSALDIFIDFFQNEGRFPGTQDNTSKTRNTIFLKNKRCNPHR